MKRADPRPGSTGVCTALAIAFGLGGWLFYTQLSASLLGVSLEDSSALSAVPPRGC